MLAANFSSARQDPRKPVAEEDPVKRDASKSKEYFLSDPFNLQQSVNQQALPGISLHAGSLNLIKKSIEVAKKGRSVAANEKGHQKSEIKAFLDLDSQRYGLKK